MMGKDIERIIKKIENIKSLMGRFVNDVGTSNFSGASSDLIDIKSMSDNLKEDYQKMKNIEKKNFISKEVFNNSIGSPWNEFDNAINQLDDFNKIASSTPIIELLDQMKTFYGLSKIHLIVDALTDTKWAITIYHDYIQRAFDALYNDNVPSITFTNDSRGNQSTGNVKQNISNNVSVKNKPLDPY